MSDPARWERVKVVLHEALAHDDVTARAAYLDEACGSDRALRAEVESLLAAHEEAGSFANGSPLEGLPASAVETIGDALRPGARVGPYEILAKLGAGGMGEVYRARDTRLGREVAVKVLFPDVASDPDRRQRFQREARAIAALSHPHICTIHDVGVETNREYLVLEMLQGESLASRLRRGPLALDEALARAIEIAGALDRAHQAGIIHRDLKPGNVMLTSSGAKVLDFGLARVISSSDIADAAALTDVTPITATGAVLGTLQYMTPEQIEGRPADARADIFAFGALLYEMITGRRAFEGSSSPALMAAILSAEGPSFDTIQPPLPPALCWLITTCLARQPDDRFASMHDVRLQLRRIASGTPDDRPARPRSFLRRYSALALAALGAGATGLLTSSWLLRAPTTEPTSRLSIALDEARLSPQDLGLALSPDGGTVVFVGASSGVNRLYTRSMNGLAVEPIENSDGAIFPFFSPDGQWLGFFANNQLLRRSTADGTVQTIARIGDQGAVASWDNDGFILFGQHGELTKAGIRRLSADGGAIEVVSRPHLPGGEVAHLLPQRLPGTDMVLYSSREVHLNGRQGNVMVRPLGGGEANVLLEGASRAVVTGDRRLVYQLGTTLLSTTIDPSTLALGRRTTIAEGVFPSVFGGAWAVAGDTIVYRPDDGFVRRLVWVSRDGQRDLVAGAPIRGYTWVDLSPDGSRVAIAMEDNDASTSTWVYHLAQGVLSKAADGLWGHLWSPDGKELAVQGGEGRTRDIYRMAADGSSEPQPVIRNASPKYAASWTSDGRSLVFMQLGDQTTGDDLWVLDLDGDHRARPIVRTPAHDLGGRLSPDGKWLAYVSNQTGQFELYVTPFPAGNARWQVSRDGAREPVWSHDGRELFYRNRRQLLAVNVRSGPTFTWDAPRVLFEGDYYERGGPGAQSYDASLDGQRFLMLEEVRPAVPRLNVIRGWRRLTNQQ